MAGVRGRKCAKRERGRMREIGIRLALGAQVGDIPRLIFVQGLKPAVIGLAIGLGSSISPSAALLLA